MDIIIPRPLQIVVDDLGWFCGTDDRQNGGASRTGMPRKHCHKDYQAMNKLGEALDQKIFCAFCLAEWDPDNRMRAIPQISKYGENWDNASYIDLDEAKKCAETINNSPYIDFGLHGMGHGYYSAENTNFDLSDYYYANGNERILTGDEYIRKVLDSFFEMMEYYGIKKEVTSFVPPSGAYKFNDLSRILADYGIKYISTPFKFMRCENCEKPVDVAFENGIITIERYNDLTKWDAHSIDFGQLPLKELPFGAHWPNWLHEDADRNDEVIDSAIKYFYRCAEQQTVIISRDMKFAVTQMVFWKYANVSENENGETVIDLSNVPQHKNMNDVFYVNSNVPIVDCVGGKISEYARKNNFISYEIKPFENIIILK